MLQLELERRKKNLTQKELSKLVKIGAPDLCRIEKKILKPYPGHLKRLSEFFGVSGEELLKEVE